MRFVRKNNVNHSYCELCGHKIIFDGVHGISTIDFEYNDRKYSYILCSNCTQKFRKWIRQNQKTTHTTKAFEEDDIDEVNRENGIY